MKLFAPILTALAVAQAVLKAQKIEVAARPYNQYISESSVKNDISPELIKAIIWKESRYDPEAIGSAGEVGLGQFKPIAAEDVGLEISKMKNPEVAISGIAKLLALNRKRFSGSMWDSLRAYNVGAGKAKQNKGAGLSYAADIVIYAAGLRILKGLKVV